MSQEAQIINIAVNIFQNVGIKRWIDQIQSLMNEQIYIQICKIIFPENMIKLFKITQSNLSSGQKIQLIINMIAEIIKLDLYHISGHHIAQGNLAHLKNFLQLLEALSQTFITASREDIHTAPEKDSNEDDSIEHGHYTVLGIPRQFQTKNMDMNELDDNPKNQLHEDDDDQVRLKPRNPDYQQNKSTKKQKKVRFKQTKEVKKKKSQSQRKISQAYAQDSSNLTDNRIKKENFTLNDKLASKKVSYIQKINNIIQQLQKNKLNDLQYIYNARKRNSKYRNSKVKQLINFQSGERNRLINSKISDRQKIVKSLKGQEEGIRAIVGMFKQQKKLHENLKREEMRKRMQSIENLMMEDQSQSLMLRSAVLSSIANIQNMNE